MSAGGVGHLDDRGRAMRSAFLKTPLTGPVPVGPLGLPGDAHVYRHHGGPDMALCVYASEHLLALQADGLDVPDAAAFGENLTTRGLLETEVRIGDVFRIAVEGTSGVLVQVSQPRSPCRKIAVRYGRPKLDLALARAGRVGWLLRVLEPGDLAAGADVLLVERDDAAVTVAEASRVLDVDRHDLGAVPAVLASAGLAPAAVEALRRRLDAA
ncbi:MOSC domain-containing protein [Jatrophihabitans sp. YIM 134969]